MAEFIKIPFREAAIEIRFPGDARIDSWRGEFQQTIRARLPQLLVPNIQPGEAVALRHYQFTNEAQTEIVSLALNSLAYAVTEYAGWEIVRTEYLRLWTKLQEQMSIRQASRIGIRYTNLFDSDTYRYLQNPSSKSYLAAFFESSGEFELKTILKRENINFLIRIIKPENQDFLIFDLDASLLNQSTAKIEATLNRLHTIIENEFFSCLEPEFRDRILHLSEVS